MVRALFLCAALVSGAALAQDDDLPALPTGKPKAKAQPARPKARPPSSKPKTPVVDDDLPALPAAKGDVVVKLASALKGAKLSIDDKEIGPMPQPPQQLTAGEHTVTVHRAGYAPFSKKVLVTGNKTIDVIATLEATTAVLAVSSDVVGAQVYVNGRFSGSTPVDELEVPPGKVELSVKKDGYRDGTQTVNVKAGHDYPIEVKLGAPITAAVAANDVPPPPPDLMPHEVVASPDEGLGTTATVEHSSAVYQQWWFWTIIGAVVVGAAVVAGVFIARGPAEVLLGRSNYGCNMNKPNGCDGWINDPGVGTIVPINWQYQHQGGH
jgi:hypothetical protein